MSSKLRITRILKNTSQYVLALTSGVSQPRLSLIENGLTKPSQEEVRRISKALKVKAEDIFPPEAADR